MGKVAGRLERRDPLLQLSVELNNALLDRAVKPAELVTSVLDPGFDCRSSVCNANVRGGLTVDQGLKDC